MQSIMLDIETLSTKTNATILSIAAIKFNELTNVNEANNETFQVLVDLDSQPDRDITDSTVTWWAQQDPAVQALVFAEEGRLTLTDALLALSKFACHSNRIWVQGPAFDIPILEHAYQQCQLPPPWQYWQVRDSRTLLDLVEISLPSPNHNALEDCSRQIKGVKLALKQLDIKKFVRQ